MGMPAWTCPILLSLYDGVYTCISPWSIHAAAQPSAKIYLIRYFLRFYEMKCPDIVLMSR